MCPQIPLPTMKKYQEKTKDLVNGSRKTEFQYSQCITNSFENIKLSTLLCYPNPSNA